jgi:hypothetical protein
MDNKRQVFVPFSLYGMLVRSVLSAYIYTGSLVNSKDQRQILRNIT